MSAIIVAGHGSMAQELISLCGEAHVMCFAFDDVELSNERMIGFPFVHFGSGRQLADCLEACKTLQSPLIQGSTGQTLPERVPVPVVDAPNLSLPIIRFLTQVLPTLQHSFYDMEATVMDSHQAGKKSVPGTAAAMANALCLNIDRITSVREPAIQRQLGVAEEHLGGHGWHWINFCGQGVNITVSTKVNGRRSYAAGALAIAEALVQHRKTLQPRVYGVAEILELMTS